MATVIVVEYEKEQRRADPMRATGAPKSGTEFPDLDSCGKVRRWAPRDPAGPPPSRVRGWRRTAFRVRPPSARLLPGGRFGSAAPSIAAESLPRGVQMEQRFHHRPPVLVPAAGRRLHASSA